MLLFLAVNKGTYTSWKSTTSEPVKEGANQVEGQFMCFPPSGTTPNFIKHLVHNFTGIQTPNANSTNVNPPSTIKNSGIPILPTVPHQAADADSFLNVCNRVILYDGLSTGLRVTPLKESSEVSNSYLRYEP